eukprot:32044-Pelagomonas_calceolata.AAC.1
MGRQGGKLMSLNELACKVYIAVAEHFKKPYCVLHIHPYPVAHFHRVEGVMGGQVGSLRGTIKGTIPWNRGPLGFLIPSLGLVGR